MTDSIQAITMPKWGLAMEEGMVVAWLAHVGGSVEAGPDLLEIETTKITNVYEAPVAGVLRRQVVAEGETVPVGALLGLVAEPSVDEAALDAYVADFNANFSIAAAAAEEGAPEPQAIAAGGYSINYLRTGLIYADAEPGGSGERRIGRQLTPNSGQSCQQSITGPGRHHLSAPAAGVGCSLSLRLSCWGNSFAQVVIVPAPRQTTMSPDSAAARTMSASASGPESAKTLR